MITGPLMFIGPLTIGEPLIVRETLFFSRDQMVRGAPTALTCFFVGFHTYFMTYVRVSVASA